MESSATVSSSGSESIPDVIHLESSLPTSTHSYARPPIKRSRGRSDVWLHFSKIESEDPNDQRAACNYCGKSLLCHSKKQGTSSLRYHIDTCKAFLETRIGMDNPQSKTTGPRRDGVDGTTSSPSFGLAKYNEEKIRMAVAKMIIVDELPFRFVEKEGFKDLMAVVEPRFSIPSRITIMRYCMKMFLLEKDKLNDIFMTSNYKICITTDMWTSVQNLNYMCITSHFIDDDWVLHKRIIGFMKVPNHKGTTIGREIESSILRWGIKKIFTITVDNASSNTTAIDYLRKITKLKDCLELDNDLIHIRCCAHILNLIVHDGLKEIDRSIVKIRNAVKYVKSSPARLENFKSCAERQNILGGALLSLDVPTRWNSTYLMLSAALNYYAAFEVMQDEDNQFGPHLREVGEGPPTLDDWKIVKIFVQFLKIFYDVTLTISGSTYATSHLFIREIASIYNHLQLHISMGDDDMLKTMSKRMLLKYDKYWGDFEKVNKILLIAAVLDPRAKLEVLEFWFTDFLGHERASELVARLRRMLERMYKQYSKSNVGSSIDESQSNTTSYNATDLYSRYRQYQASKGVVESKSELDRYFMGSLEGLTPNFDILMWWKMNSINFSILANIARDVLAIPISTVASESTFSVGGRILDSFRSSLAPATVEALICTQNWLMSPSVNYDSQDVIEDAESYKLDTEMTLMNILNETD